MKTPVSKIRVWWHFTGAVCLIVAANAAHGVGVLPSYYQDPGLSPFRSTVNHNNDEHIDPFTGMLQLHHVDMTLPGNGGFDLVLQRALARGVRWRWRASLRAQRYALRHDEGDH